MQAKAALLLYKYRYPLIVTALVIAVFVAVYVFGRKAGKQSSTNVKIPWTPTDNNSPQPASNFNPVQHAKNIRELWGGDNAWWNPVGVEDFVQGCNLLIGFANKNEWILVSNAYNKAYEKKNYPTIRSLLAANDYPVTVSAGAKTLSRTVMEKLDHYNL